MNQLAWSQSQSDALQKLVHTAEVYFSRDWSGVSFRPKLDLLVIGPSGCGKSHVVQAMTTELNIPFLRLTYGEWLVAGARSCTTTTIERVRRFLDLHDRAIIQLDELDKARTGFQREWSIAVYTEIFSLLDRTTALGSLGASWTQDQAKKLQFHTLFVGTGTWQSTWQQIGKEKLGFGLRKETEDVADLIRKAQVIPAELLRRFSNDFIVLNSGTADDYRRAANEHGIATLAENLGHTLDYAQAEASSLGARWLQEIYGSLLVEAHRQGKLDQFSNIPPLVSEDSEDETQGDDSCGEPIA